MIPIPNRIVSSLPVPSIWPRQGFFAGYGTDWEFLGFYFFWVLEDWSKNLRQIQTLLEAPKSMIEVVTLQVFWSICLFSWFCWYIMAPKMFQRTLPSWRIHQATWHLQSLYSDSFSANEDPLSSTSINKLMMIIFKWFPWCFDFEINISLKGLSIIFFPQYNL